jgi:hypothetical protein
VQWLHDHGDEVHDPTGLLVGRMRTELGKGRALSQLIGDMARDGMIEREVNGKRTLMIKLVDDWGLLAELDTVGYRRVPTPEPDGAAAPGDVDLTALAETLLALVLKRSQPTAQRSATTEKLEQQLADTKAQLAENRDALILARESEKEALRQADKMRDSLAKLQGKIDAKPKRGETPLVERLSDGERRMLDQLMRSMPASK